MLPENSTFDFDQGKTLVLPSQGLTEFSQMSHLSGRKHNFYHRIFSTQFSNIEFLLPENSTFDFDQGKTLVLPSRGFSEFSLMRHLVGRRHNFYHRIFSTQFSNIESKPQRNEKLYKFNYYKGLYNST
jgi:hypothetical protein